MVNSDAAKASRVSHMTRRELAVLRHRPMCHCVDHIFVHKYLHYVPRGKEGSRIVSPSAHMIGVRGGTRTGYVIPA